MCNSDYHLHTRTLWTQCNMHNIGRIDIIAYDDCTQTSAPRAMFVTCGIHRVNGSWNAFETMHEGWVICFNDG